MKKLNISVTPFVPESASDRENERLNDFLNIMRAEQLPEDPPIPLEERIQAWKNIPEFVDNEVWLAWDEPQSEVIGYGEGAIWHTGDNEHAGQFVTLVHPLHRDPKTAARSPRNAGGAHRQCQLQRSHAEDQP